jgi:Fe-S cluster biogenesis protein NfuA
MTLRERVESVLEEVRPALEAHGGNVDLVEVEDSGAVKVALTGACKGCPMSQMTLTMGIERVLKENIPEVTEVINVSAPAPAETCECE